MGCGGAGGSVHRRQIAQQQQYYIAAPSLGLTLSTNITTVVLIALF